MMVRNLLTARLLAWLATILILVGVYMLATWIFYILVLPVITFIFEATAFIQLTELIYNGLLILFLLFSAQRFVALFTKLLIKK